MPFLGVLEHVDVIWDALVIFIVALYLGGKVDDVGGMEAAAVFQ